MLRGSQRIPFRNAFIVFAATASSIRRIFSALTTLSTETLSSEDPSAAGLPMRPALFVSFQAASPLAGASRHWLDDLDEVRIGRGEPLCRRELLPGIRCLQIQLPDARLSRSHAVIRRQSDDGFVLVDCDSKNGSFVGGVAARSHLLADEDRLELGSTFFTFRRLRHPRDGAPDVTAGVDQADFALTTILPELARRFDSYKRAANSTLSLLVIGKTGTGKELAARAAHALSRRAGPFVALNCGALPSTLLEAELFGYRKGAFSGALEDRVGLVRASDGGTLFLDEVGELSAAAQTALLRVLQEGEVLPIGHVRPSRVDLRVIAATNRDLKQMVEDGVFRPDLHARLQGVTLSLLPLRERRDEFGLLVSSLLRRLAGERARDLSFTTAAARRLIDDPWPLNVRGLEKCLSAALVLGDRNTIDLEGLDAADVLEPAQATASPSQTQTRTSIEDDAGLSDEDRKQRAQLTELMRKHEGNISAIAREVGKTRFQIRRWIKRFRLR
ncbi:MAG: Sigma-54 dependent transcriptional regulator [bacterium]|nr:Sigma-54 dependent transcriptional regulator [bacterium]